MGYMRFEGNESDVMNAFLRAKKIPAKDDLHINYPYQKKSLLRKKMIAKAGKFYVITPRGISAITQQNRDDRYWVIPLKTRPFSFGKAKIRVPKDMMGYFR